VFLLPHSKDCIILSSFVWIGYQHVTDRQTELPWLLQRSALQAMHCIAAACKNQKYPGSDQYEQVMQFTLFFYYMSWLSYVKIIHDIDTVNRINPIEIFSRSVKKPVIMQHGFTHNNFIIISSTNNPSVLVKMQYNFRCFTKIG